MRLMTRNARWALLCLLVWAAPVPAFGQAHSPELEQAMASFYQQNFDEAIAGFEQVLQRDPQNSLAMAYMLHAYYKKRDINAIINKIEQRAVGRGEDPVALAQLGMAYFLRGMIMPAQLDEALTEFKTAIKDDPNLAMAYTGMGMVYFQKRMMPRAKGYFIRALRINPHDIMALDMLGNIMLVDEKKPEDALQLYQRAAAELPTYPDAQYYIGSSLFDLGRFEEAIPYLLQARELDPNGLTKGFDAATLLGDSYLKAARKAEAIDAFEVALKMQPDSKYVAYKLKEARKGGGDSAE